MPHFWTMDSSGKWGILPLGGESCAIALDGDVPRLISPEAGPGDDSVRVLILPPATMGRSPSWTLLAGRSAPVRVHGRALSLGLRVLRDRDEISVDGRRLFFSTEELARVVPFPGLAQPACCPRCKQKLEPGDSAVCCPGCHGWHHQSETFSCWTYDATCAFCQSNSTALDAGYSWTPEQL